MPLFIKRVITALAGVSVCVFVHGGAFRLCVLFCLYYAKDSHNCNLYSLLFSVVLWCSVVCKCSVVVCSLEDSAVVELNILVQKDSEYHLQEGGSATVPPGHLYRMGGVVSFVRRGRAL
jgi:hypothetical protein